MQKIINYLKPAKHLIFSILCVLPAFLAFYPRTFVTIDEHDYLYNAQLIVTSDLKTDCSLNIPGQWPTNLGYCISKYNVGTSFFLIPAALTTLELAALITLTVFIIGIIIFYRILVIYGIDKRFIYFFALFPAFTFFSRTVLSEMYSMVLLLSIFYCFLNISRNWSYKVIVGLLITLALYVRYTNIIPIGVIGLYFIYEYLKGERLSVFLKRFWIVHITFLLGIVSILIFNYIYYGGVFRSGYYFSSEEGSVIWEQIPAIFFKYFVLLNMFYPFSLIILFRTKIKRSLLFILTVLGVLSFYTLFKNESFPGKLSDVILGLRFIIPVYPFLLLPYFYKLNQYGLFKKYRFFMYTSIAILVIVTLLINYIHYKYILK